MTSHNWLDGLGCLVRVVEWDGADVVMKNVGLDNAVEELTTDETKLTVDGGSGAADVVP